MNVIYFCLIPPVHKSKKSTAPVGRVTVPDTNVTEIDISEMRTPLTTFKHLHEHDVFQTGA